MAFYHTRSFLLGTPQFVYFLPKQYRTTSLQNSVENKETMQFALYFVVFSFTFNFDHNSEEFESCGNVQKYVKYPKGSKVAYRV